MSPSCLPPEYPPRHSTSFVRSPALSRRRTQRLTPNSETQAASQQKLCLHYLRVKTSLSAPPPRAISAPRSSRQPSRARATTVRDISSLTAKALSQSHPRTSVYTPSTSFFCSAPATKSHLPRNPPESPVASRQKLHSAPSDPGIGKSLFHRASAPATSGPRPPERE